MERFCLFVLVAVLVAMRGTGSAAPVSLGLEHAGRPLDPDDLGPILDPVGATAAPSLAWTRSPETGTAEDWSALFRTNRPVYDLWSSPLDCYGRALR
jgi:hypothetical protein